MQHSIALGRSSLMISRRFVTSLITVQKLLHRQTETSVIGVYRDMVWFKVPNVWWKVHVAALMVAPVCSVRG